MDAVESNWQMWISKTANNPNYILCFVVMQSIYEPKIGGELNELGRNYLYTYSFLLFASGNVPYVLNIAPTALLIDWKQSIFQIDFRLHNVS